MRLSLFSRLVLGYLAVFTLVSAVSLYAIWEFRRFNEIGRSILDTRALDYEKRLSDSLLSQIRYERKFVIVKDPALYREFQKFKADFQRQLEQSRAEADSKTAPLLTEIQRDFGRYQELFAKEMIPIREHQNYPQDWYAGEKTKITDSILEALDRLQSERQRETYEKVRQLAEAGARARQAAMIISAASLAFIVLLSFVTTRSITRPIGALKKKTNEIAGGKFVGDLVVRSPREIGELAAAFNFMCQKLNELEKVKADFFASMSHELRTPLTSIKEGTGLLLEGVGGATTEKQTKLLTILAEESNRLIGLVNSLLDLSKMEAGMMAYNFEKSSLGPLIHKAVVELSPLVEAKGIQLETEFGPELPAVNLDRERILQVLRNLIGNAVKFTPKAGRVKVFARRLDGQVEVSVHDTGPGIPSENIKTIFDKFQQGTQGRGFSSNGTGLGLAIAKHIVVSHGGNIWAENHLKQGSTFIFVLPS